MTDFAKLSLQELHKKIADAQESLRAFRFSGAGGRARDTREGRTLRKTIARMLTEAQARKLAETQKKA
jgi:ribosomal protein L29